MLCLFSVSIAIQSVGRLFGDSEHDPFRLCVVLVTGTNDPHRGKNQARFDDISGRDDSRSWFSWLFSVFDSNS